MAVNQERLGVALYKGGEQFKNKTGSDTQTADKMVFGHTIRSNGLSFENMMIERNIEGKRSHGRTRMRLTDQIKTITGYPPEGTIRIKMTENHKRWMIYNIHMNQ